MKGKRKNSREKGKCGEREACAVMEAATGEPWRRTAQVRGKNQGAPDIEPVDPASAYRRLHVECKRRETIDLGTKELDNAVAQARSEACGMPWLVLWRASRRPWAATTEVLNAIVTGTDIKAVACLSLMRGATVSLRPNTAPAGERAA